MSTASKVSCRMQWTVINVALTLEPDHAAAYNGMGNVYRDQGQLQDAMDSYKRCLTLEPDHAAAYDCMAFVCRKESLFRNKLDTFARILHFKRDDAVDYYKKGNVYQQQGQLQKRWTAIRIL